MPGTTPVYGFPYPEPTDLVADYPALGQQLAEDVEAVLPTLGGLSPATPTSIANSGGTATLTSNTVTITGVNSVSLNGVFTSTYQAYRVIIVATGSTDGSAGVATRMRLRAAGVDYTTNTYAEFGVFANAAGGPSRFFNNSITYGAVGYHFDFGGHTAFEISRPATTGLNKHLISSSMGTGTAEGYSAHIGVRVLSTAVYDGLTIYPASGTLTGTVRVFKYNN